MLGWALAPSTARPAGRMIAAEPGPYLPPSGLLLTGVGSGAQQGPSSTTQPWLSPSACTEPGPWGNRTYSQEQRGNPLGNSEADVGDPTEGTAGLGEHLQHAPSTAMGNGLSRTGGFSHPHAGESQEKVNPSPTTSRSQECRGRRRKLQQL